MEITRSNLRPTWDGTKDGLPNEKTAKAQEKPCWMPWITLLNPNDPRTNHSDFPFKTSTRSVVLELCQWDVWKPDLSRLSNVVWSPQTANTIPPKKPRPSLPRSSC